jgi:molecular chaperone GrpE
MIEEIKKRATDALEETREKSSFVEKELDRLSGIKSAFSAVEKELGGLIKRLENESSLGAGHLEEIEDALYVIKDEIEEKSRDLEHDKADEYLKRLQYLQADFKNYKKRARKEREEITKFANEGLIVQLLDIIDNFERALGSAKGIKKSFMKGIDMVYKGLISILENEGVKPIETMGEKFDPFKQEAVMVVEDSEHDEDEIVEELQKGYMLGDKVIRYAKVKIAKSGRVPNIDPPLEDRSKKG